MEPTQLDPTLVNLAKSLRQVESGGDFNAKGASGEHGAYQFMPSTWSETAPKYGVTTALDKATPEEQNKVAYSQLADWKKQHPDWNVGNFASAWNAGSGKPNAYLEGNAGVNSQGVKYDTAAYAKKVAETYQQVKNSQQTNTGFNPNPYSNPTNSSNPGSVDYSGTPHTEVTNPTPTKDSLGTELAGRLNDANGAITNIVGGKKTGQSRVSGVLQLVGAAAGGLGDVVNKGIELIPGVKALEEVIGKKVGQLAQTEGGKAIVGSLQQFSKDHPELSKDIGAGFNIATAIPILKGIGTVANVALDGASLALKNTAEKIAVKDLTATAERTIGGRTAVKAAPDAVKTLITERALPDIAEGKYATKEAFEKLSNDISHIENTELQPALAQASGEAVSQRQPLEELRKQAIADIKQEFKGSGDSLSAEREINRKFDGFKNEYGDYVSIQDMNDMKRGVRQSVNFNSPKLDSDVSYHLGQVFQKNVEESAAKLGLGDVNAINQKMARLIKAQNILKHIEGKPVKTGFVGGVIKNGATVGGEMLGNSSGIPLAGAYLGRNAGAYTGKRLASISKGILERTGKDAVRTTGEKALKRTAGLVGFATAQKAAKK